MKQTDFDIHLQTWLKEADHAAQYLIEIIEDTDAGMDDALIAGLRDVVAAFGVTEIASKANIHRTHLHRILDGKASPRLSTLRSILAAVGVQLSVQPIPGGAALCKEPDVVQAHPAPIAHLAALPRLTKAVPIQAHPRRDADLFRET